MKKALLVLLLAGLLAPGLVFAHPLPIKTPEMYNQQVFVTELSIDDDDNWFGPADVWFDWIVDAIDPKHEEQQGLLEETFQVHSGEAVVFDPPVEIYSHNTCHCDEEFDIDVAVFDYAPIKNGLWKMLGKGLEYLKSYLISGTTGVAIHVVGDILNAIVEAITVSGLSDEDKEYLALVKFYKASNDLGAMRHIIETPCEPADESYAGDLLVEEVANGTLTYRIVKTPTGELCETDEPADDVPDDEPPEEPGEAMAPPMFPDPDPGTAPPAAPDDEEGEEPEEPAEPVSGGGGSSGEPEQEPDKEPSADGGEDRGSDEEPLSPEPEPAPEPEPSAEDEGDKTDSTDREEESGADQSEEENPSEPEEEKEPPAEDVPPEPEPEPEPADEEETPECNSESGMIYTKGEYSCPVGTIQVKTWCECLEGYSWSDPTNLCAGCINEK